MADPPQDDWKIPADDQLKIIEALDRKGATGPCPRCSNANFALVEGYVSLVIHRNVRTVQLGGASVPLVAIYCTRCGWTALHAVGALGLMAQARGETQPVEGIQK